MDAITTGIVNLAKAATLGIIGITVVVVGGLLTYFFLRRSHSDDHEMVMWDKRIRTALISGAGVLTASGLTAWVLNFFGGK